MTNSAAAFDQRALRNVLGTFVTGVTVVTTRDKEGTAHGVTANSFSSLSLDPPLVLWSQALTSRSFPAFRDSDHFAVNILADDQVDVSNQFAKSRDDKFSGIAHRAGIGDVPVLDGAAAHLECVKLASHLSGDHMLFIGRIERIGHYSRKGLAFGAGSYLRAYAYDVGPVDFRMQDLRPVSPETIRRASSGLGEVAARLGEHTLCLSVWGNHGPTAVYWEPSRKPVSDQLFTGLVMPISQSAAGKAFAAFLPRSRTERFIEEDLRLFGVPGEDLDTRRRGFDAEVDEVRQRGLARMASQEESPLHKVAITTFSAPIQDAHGNMSMALSVASTALRLPADWEGEIPRGLKAAAEEVSGRLR